jgi:sugar lactone lactonase YvrE
MEDLVGRQFGSYRVVAALGEGGMASVYKAYQPAVDRYVALKVLGRHLATDPQFLQRFRHEAKIIAQLQHPHILPVFDFGDADNYTFLTMPFVSGGTLADSMTNVPSSLDFAERVIQQVGSALDYAHAKGIVHRDIKPKNILIDEGKNCLVADFGIARIAEGATRLTVTGSMLGTPAYMSPEQAAGEVADAQSDLYSLGIMLYEMLTGRVPFKAETPVAVALKHLNAPLPSPRDFNPELSPLLERVVLKALARSKTDRFASGAAFAAAVSQAVSQEKTTLLLPASAAPAPDRMPTAVAAPPERLASRTVTTERATDITVSPMRTAGGVVAVLVVGSLLAYMAWQGRRTSTELQPGPGNTAAVTTGPQPQASPAESPARGSAPIESPVRAPKTPATQPANSGSVPGPVTPVPMTSPPLDVPRVVSRALQSGAGAAYAVSVSPGSRRLAAGYETGVVKIWDPGSGKEVSSLGGQIGSVSGVAFSPDGRLLASTSKDRIVRLWDLARQIESRRLVGHSEAVWAVAFSPDSRTVATASSDTTARLWSSDSGAVREVLSGHTDWVTSVLFASDGKSVITGSRDRTVRVWDASRGRVLMTLEDAKAPIWSVAVSTKAGLIAAGADDGSVSVWDSDTGQMRWSTMGHKGSVWALAFSADGTLLASGGADALVRLLDPTSGKVTQTFRGHAEWVRGLAFDDATTWLASAGGDGDVRTWRIARD